MRTPEVLVIGDANPDLVLTGDVVPRFGQAEKLVDSADLVLGSSAGIVACGLARLGVPTALAAVVGDDVFGAFVIEQLAEAGVDTRWIRTDRATATAVTVVLSAGDRAILTYPGTLASTGPEIVDADLVSRVRHLHSASLFLLPRLAPHLPAVFAAARSAGAGTSVDTNWDPAGQWSGVTALLAQSDVVLPNAAELLALTGRADLDEAARQITATGCRVALKNGAAGGTLWEPSADPVTVAAPPTDPVDTTGAGDSFDAGFISGMLDGLSGAQCLARAVLCGSLSTRGVGGTAAQPTRAELAVAR
ncbi:carbohydrate kinase family protein [Mycolicibacterium sp. CH28]|uniref:carbohydrate kinase family protein n=1 Tax=Mycolicibacterium sp. CH28 TaxID=2512237 RepID=UPI0010816152|nr:carbohydrate kinase family protein [Mycolicibacterium sp. CH28]TGD86694.1 carbohydrate kinase family protein [Mycolicibacterium sp. CH28]